jgi:hypothetical protein
MSLRGRSVYDGPMMRPNASSSPLVSMALGLFASVMGSAARKAAIRMATTPRPRVLPLRAHAYTALALIAYGTTVWASDHARRSAGYVFSPGSTA